MVRYSVRLFATMYGKGALGVRLAAQHEISLASSQGCVTMLNTGVVEIAERAIMQRNGDFNTRFRKGP
jgi:small ligand-binding sensory domain FIST